MGKKSGSSLLIVLLSLGTYLCFLGALLSFKKSVCIDSKLVNKIDSVGTQLPIVYACSLNRSSKYSYENEQLAKSVQNKLASLEVFILTIKPLTKKVHIYIRSDRPQMYSFSNGQLNIGKDLLDVEGLLVRGVIKAWIQENKNELKLESDLYEEVWTDFIQYAVMGKLEISNPNTKLKTKIGLIRWPQILKTADAYCKSAWVWTEHLESCENGDFQLANKGQTSAAILSLRPLLTNALITAYNSLSYLGQKDIIFSIPNSIQFMNLTSEQIIESLVDQNNSLLQGIQNINKFNNLFHSAALKIQNANYYKLYDQFNRSLNLSGVNLEGSEAYFDLLVQYDGELDTDSNLFKSFEKTLSPAKDKQVAIMDKKQIWILPSRSGLPVDAFLESVSKTRIYFKCNNKDSIKLDRFYDKADKLILIKDCHQNSQYNFQSLAENNLMNFYKQNLKLSFIQFHLPSLQMLKNKVNTHQNFFELVKNKNLNDSDIKSMGWADVEWESDINVYKPKAVVDAIEFYRN